jgi:four helix bundle protein
MAALQPPLRLGRDIAERLLSLAAASIRLASRLPKDPGGRHVAMQLVQSATSAGANYEEARAAESRQDFIHKVGIAAKEARETAFWLALTGRCYLASSEVAAVIEAARQLAAILGASVRTARANAGRSGEGASL